MIKKDLQVLKIGLILMLASAGLVRANTYYVSTKGNDSNTGTMNSPFYSVSKATSKMNAGDTVYVFGGTYFYSVTISISSSKFGSDSAMYDLFAYPGDTVIFDFYKQPYGSSYRGVKLKGSYWYFKGITIKNAGDNGLYITGTHNRIEHCNFIGNDDTGLQISGGGAYNLIINCDSYYNADPTNQNADGFAAKLDVGPGNKFIACRSWNNSDDGWDFYEADTTVVLDSCLAFRNGYLANGSPSNGNGNGFKVGGNFVAGDHLVKNCISFDNRKNGYHLNNNTGQVTLINNLGFDNKDKNYDFPLASSGPHTFINNISFGGANSDDLINCDQTTNSWQGFSPSADDYINLDTALASAPRFPDGSLPSNNFAHLKPGSPLIDAGTDAGYPFEGLAPDLGPYESPSVTMANTVNVSVEGRGNVWITPPGGIYDTSQEITLIATPHPGYSFDRWSGDVSGSNDTLTFILDSTVNITASFKLLDTVPKDSMRIEAENMVFYGYSYARNASASNGKVIIPASTSLSTASYIFRGDSDNYLVHVNYYDATVDSSTYRFWVNDSLIVTWYGNKATSTSKFTVKTIYNVMLKPGDVIKLQSNRSGSELGMIDYMDLIKSAWIPVDINTISFTQKRSSIGPCVPNPINSTGQIKFFLGKPDFVRLDLYDLQGKLVRNLTRGYYNQGKHVVEIDRSNLPSGVYFCKMITGTEIFSQKLIFR